MHQVSFTQNNQEILFPLIEFKKEELEIVAKGKTNIFNKECLLSIRYLNHLQLVLEEQEEKVVFDFSHQMVCQAVEGSFLGVKASLRRQKERVYEGELSFQNGLKLAEAFPQFSKEIFCLSRCKATGIFVFDYTNPSFQGKICGKTAAFKNLQEIEFQGEVECKKSKFLSQRLDLSSSQGEVVLKQINIDKEEELWCIKVAILRGKNIQFQEGDNCFIFRSCLFTDLYFEWANPYSLKGKGVVAFVQKSSKEYSLLDIPLNLLKDVGFDPGLFNPVSGEIGCLLKEGRLYFTQMSRTFSEGRRSEFFLLEKAPLSYIDFKGKMAIFLEIKQRVLLKMGEPFILSISGSVEKPCYEIIPK